MLIESAHNGFKLDLSGILQGTRFCTWRRQRVEPYTRCISFVGRVSLTKWIASREFTFLSNGNIILENGFNWKNLGNSLDPQTFNSIFSLDAVASYGEPKKKVLLVEVEQSKTKANNFASDASTLPLSLASLLLPFFVLGNL